MLKKKKKEEEEEEKRKKEKKRKKKKEKKKKKKEKKKRKERPISAFPHAVAICAQPSLTFRLVTFGEELRNGPLSQHKNNQWVVWLVGRWMGW